MQSCPWVAMSKTHEQNHESFTKLMSSCWRLLKPWVSHLQNHLQGVNIICNNLKSFATATSCVGRTKKRIYFAKKKNMLLRQEKKTFKTNFSRPPQEVKLMKKFPKKLICFSPHRWYVFFFTPPLIYVFFWKKRRIYCLVRKKRPQSIIFKCCFFVFFCLLSVLCFVANNVFRRKIYLRFWSEKQLAVSDVLSFFLHLM